MNSYQDLVIIRDRLFNLLQLEVGYTIVAIDDGFHRISWGGGLAAIVRRPPIGDKHEKKCEHQQDKDDAKNPLQYSFHKLDAFLR